METSDKTLVIGMEGNYFGKVVKRQSYRSLIAAETRYTAATCIPRHSHKFAGFFLALRGSVNARGTMFPNSRPDECFQTAPCAGPGSRATSGLPVSTSVSHPQSR